MSRKITILLFFMFAISMSWAQRTITGTVTDDAGEPLIGASVVVKGMEERGTITDFDGKYSLIVENNAEYLIFSYTGYSAQEVLIGTQSVINATLMEGITLTSAVVTALNITRDEKSLGYSVQQVEADDLTRVQETNLVGALAGKVSGVQVISGASSSVGSSAKIRIRGVSGLTGGDPLFVMDGTPMANNNFSSGTGGADFGNLMSDINTEDIENISVLKGPAATALYGERAKHGVVMITSKKGKARRGLGVTFKSAVSLESVYILPSYQDEYAGGYDQNFIDVVDPRDGQTYQTLEYSADESWGPRMEGQTYRPYWSWFDDENYGQTAQLTPNPNNVRDFFETGVTNTNSIAFTGGTEKINYRLGFTNLNQTGVLPNSKFTRNNVNLGLEAQITNRLTLISNVNLVFNNSSGRPSFGYSPTTGNSVQSFNQWFQRQLDMERLRDYKAADGTFKTWNIRSFNDPGPLYWDSPFFSVYENVPTDRRNRYFGDITMRYRITDKINISGSLRRDNFNQRIEERIATGGLEEDYYREYVVDGQEDNYEVIGTYTDRFGDISLDANLGGNLRQNRLRSNNAATVGGLNVPNLFTLGASIDRPTVTSFTQAKDVQSVFGALNLGFRDYLYVGGTLRNDWSSSLPIENNSYLYPSGNVSFVFSELLGLDVLTYGKLRASVAQVGSDVDPYRIAFAYGLGTPYGSSPSFNVPDLLPNEDLRPAITTSWETGIDLRFFRNRLGLDLTYYVNNSVDEILSIQVAGSSGFGTALINAGNIQSKGIELGLSATPVTSSNFEWNTRLNFARNTSQVIELSEGIDNYLLANGIGGAGWGGLTLNAAVGEQWGLLRGGGYTYIDGSDLPRINPNGSYVRTANKDLGSILPDFTGGFTNSFNIYGITLGAHIDFQAGGQFFSVTKMFNNYSGLGIETVGNNDKGNPIRDAVADGGGIRVDGVNADGAETTVYVEAVTYYARLFGFHEEWIYDASFVKLRELSIGYNLPKRLLGNRIQSLNVSLVARNPWLIYSTVEGLDPSEILPGANNLIFEERGQLPSARSFGISVTVGL